MSETVVELTHDQEIKLEILNDNGITLGDAIDMLFEIKEEIIFQSNEYLNNKIDEVNKEKSALENRLDELEHEIYTIKKLKDKNTDIDEKSKIFMKEYGNTSKASELRSEEAKRRIIKAHDFFKF